mgnify:CR=1 FL=1
MIIGGLPPPGAPRIILCSKVFDSLGRLPSGSRPLLVEMAGGRSFFEQFYCASTVVTCVAASYTNV